MWLYVGGLSKPDRGLPPGWYVVFLTVRLLAVGYLVWRVWHTAAQRAEAPAPYDEADTDGTGPLGPPGLEDHPGQDTEVPSGSGVDDDSDAVVDELAGDFTDAPDQLLSVSPESRPVAAGPVDNDSALSVPPGTLCQVPPRHTSTVCLRGSHCNPPVTETP